MFGGDDHLSHVIRRDKIKEEFAQRHGFVLIRIPYIEYKNIETILKKALFVQAGL